MSNDSLLKGLESDCKGLYRKSNCDQFGRTAFHYACFFKSVGFLSSVHALIKKDKTQGIDSLNYVFTDGLLRHADAFGLTPIDYLVIFWGDYSIQKEMLNM